MDDLRCPGGLMVANRATLVFGVMRFLGFCVPNSARYGS
jgi:hypothetical protein